MNRRWLLTFPFAWAMAMTPFTGLSASGVADADSLLRWLAGGGHVIYWRHAATDRSQGDRDLRDMQRCETQRNLSALGREQARRVGEGMKTMGIPVGRVLSSPFCRNWETAQEAFGRYEIVQDLWNLPAVAASPFSSQQLVQRLQQRLGTVPEDPATNTVLVGHNLNLQAAAGVRIDEGGIAVFKPSTDGRVHFLGTLVPEDF
jgi:phosphohistidine phosphatase SixA